MKEKLMLLFVSLFLSVNAAVAQKTVTGTVTEEDGTPLIGVSIAVKGGTPVAVTDFDGNYSAQVKDDAVLVFSYLGMQNKEMKVTSSVHNVVMIPESTTITELVVTAMGVSQEKKKMNFAVQALDSEELTASKATNFTESLRGKIAGVNFSDQGGSPNAASQIIIRGVSSINSVMSNEPLFVLDGMHMSGGSSAMAVINPNDIENITVLKGAAASALYGQDGANGVVMVTTKSGAKGKLTINASASFQIDDAVRVPEVQTMYMPGSFGILKERTLQNGWGPLIPEGTPLYKNAENYLETGFLHKYDVSVSGGSEKFTSYASVSYSKHDGIIINDYSNRVGFLLKGSYDPSPTLNLSFIANISNAESRDANSLSKTATDTKAMDGVYAWSATTDMSNYLMDNGKDIRWLYDYESGVDEAQYLIDNVVSPYWRRHKDGKKSESTRNLLQASGSWKPIKGLVLSGRLGYDHSNSATNQFMTPKLYRSNLNQAEEDVIASSREFLGKYQAAFSRSSLFTAQAMINYRAELTSDWAVEAMLGTESRINKGFSSTQVGYEFDETGTISMNTVNFYDKGNSPINRRKTKKYGFFGELRVDYKGILQLSGTLRNDHSSTFIKDNNSYYYPSFTGGFIFSELFKIRSDFFDYGKIRGNWAKVGKDAYAYAYGRKFIQKPTLPDGGIGTNPTLAVADDNLKPEMSKSWEIGADLRFFKGKTSLDISYYSTAVDNQIVTVRVSPAAGHILMTRNEGNIENKGMEVSLQQEILSNRDFNWRATLNFSYNRGRLKYLPDNVEETTSIQVGDAFGTAYVGGSTTAISGKDYLRTDDGQIICNEDGTPQLIGVKGINIGDREPDFIAGLTNNFKYKDFGLSFLIDFRKGGDVMNATSRSMWGNGQHKRIETYRNREMVIDGVVRRTDGEGNVSYIKNTTPVVFDQTFINNYFVTATSNFVEDGSYIRLSYVTLSYDLSKFVKKTPIKGLNVSLTGRNLLLITRYSGSDPEISQGATGGSGSMGFDNMNVPKTRSFNLSVNATF